MCRSTFSIVIRGMKFSRLPAGGRPLSNYWTRQIRTHRRSSGISMVPSSRLPDRRKVFQRGQILSFAFREQLFNGTHVAFGFPCGQPNRIRVPRERAIDLRPQFAAERIVGENIEFAGVTVVEAAALNTPAAELLRRLMDWMQLQRASGRRSKKLLQYEASIEFEAHLTTRMFDVVYKAVFDSPRGHPSAKGL
jgi:hypothetical protein